MRGRTGSRPRRRTRASRCRACARPQRCRATTCKTHGIRTPAGHSDCSARGACSRAQETQPSRTFAFTMNTCRTQSKNVVAMRRCGPSRSVAVQSFSTPRVRKFASASAAVEGRSRSAARASVTAARTRREQYCEHVEEHKHARETVNDGGRGIECRASNHPDRIDHVAAGNEGEVRDTS